MLSNLAQRYIYFHFLLPRVACEVLVGTKLRKDRSKRINNQMSLFPVAPAVNVQGLLAHLASPANGQIFTTLAL